MYYHYRMCGNEWNHEEDKINIHVCQRCKRVGTDIETRDGHIYTLLEADQARFRIRRRLERRLMGTRTLGE